MTHRAQTILAVLLLAMAGAVAAQEHPSHEHQHGHPTADHRFADAERWSERFDSAERDAWQRPDEVMALMEIDPGMTAVDIGAGTGYFLGPLSQAVGADGAVVGLDIESGMVEFVRERAEREGWGNVEARVVEPDDPGLEPASVDRILIVNTWHHIGGREAYAEKLLRALRPGGRLYIVDFTMETSHGPPPAHRLEPERVIAELEAAGFAAETAKESLPEQYVVVGRQPN